MRNHRAILWATLAILALGTTGVGARPQSGDRHPPAPFPVRLSGLPPGSDVEVALLAGSIGKTATTKADSSGDARLVLESVSIGKTPQRAEVYVDECPDGKVTVSVVDEGSVPPAAQNCKRRRLGAFWLHRTRSLTINTAEGGITAQTRGISTRTLAILAGVGAGVAVIVATSGGSSGGHK